MRLASPFVDKRVTCECLSCAVARAQALASAQDYSPRLDAVCKCAEGLARRACGGRRLLSLNPELGLRVCFVHSRSPLIQPSGGPERSLCDRHACYDDRNDPRPDLMCWPLLPAAPMLALSKANPEMQLAPVASASPRRGAVHCMRCCPKAGWLLVAGRYDLGSMRAFRVSRAWLATASTGAVALSRLIEACMAVTPSASRRKCILVRYGGYHQPSV